MFFDEDGVQASGITISFKSRYEFQLSNCMQKSRPFDSELRSKDNRLWTIEKRGYRMIVSCNGIIVIDVTASTETCTDVEYSSWGHNVVEMTFDQSKSSEEGTLYYLGIYTNLFKTHTTFHSVYRIFAFNAVGFSWLLYQKSENKVHG